MWFMARLAKFIILGQIVPIQTSEGMIEVDQ